MHYFLIALLIIYLLGLWQGRSFISYAPYHTVGHGFGGGITVILVLLVLVWFFNPDISTIKGAFMQEDQQKTEHAPRPVPDEIPAIDSLNHKGLKGDVPAYDEARNHDTLRLDTLRNTEEEKTYYIIQVGAFANEENALKSLNGLPGTPPVKRWLCDEEKGLFKVRIGIFETKQTADNFNLLLQRWGYKGGLVFVVTSAELRHFSA